jgi:hypothetical protein
MDKLSWIDSNGTEHPFTNDKVVLQGKQGFYMPPIAHVDEQVPFHAGTRYRDTIINARDIDVPLLIKADSPLTLRQKVRECLRMFNPLYDGRIKVIAPDGTQRELHCRYASGLEGNESKDAKGTYWQTVVLVFRAFDPYWYDSQTIVETFKLNQSPGLFFPIPPLRLVSSTVFADMTIDNTGDVETYPEWIITGPGENIVLENMTTGEITELASSLGIGESITINTKPYVKTVKRNDSVNLYVDLSDNSSLWALQAGINNIRIQMSGATELSSVQLSYKNRYLGV